MDSAVRADSKETAALWQVNAAFREAELGNASLGRQGVAAALTLSTGRDVKTVSALTLARIGDQPRAKALVGELEKNYPLNTMLELYCLPAINASIELNTGNSSQTIMDSKPPPYETGTAAIVHQLPVSRVRTRASLPAGTQRDCRNRRVPEAT